MHFIDYNSYLDESDITDNKKKVTKNGRIESEFGWLDYYYEISDIYPNGLLVDLGGHVDMKHRNKGVLKDLLKQLFSSVPEGTIVQMVITNHKLIHMFKRLGFKQVKRIEYWGENKHAMEAIITKELINSI